MNPVALREKIKDQFNEIIEDPSKLTVLEGIFDSITAGNPTYLIPEEHYKLIRDRREKYHSGNSAGASWEEVKQRLIKKHGL